MSEEQKMDEQKNNECKCFCHSKGFRRFVTIALGTFVGVYCALSLFAALHRPPMPPQVFMPCNRPCPAIQYNYHNKADKPDFHGKGHPQPAFQKDVAPFEEPRVNK